MYKNFTNPLAAKNSLIKLNYTFVSYIPLSQVKTLPVLSHEYRKRKLTIKQSYLIFAWFQFTQTLLKTKKTSFLVFPKKKKIFTTTKAPIAHKNWSKEQHEYKFFTYKIVISSRLTFPLLSADLLLFLLLINNNNHFDAATSLLFLKSLAIRLSFSDKIFFFNSLR